MSKLSSTALGSPQDLLVSSTVQGADLGTAMTTGDGRYFRYCLVGGTSLVTGTLIQAPAQVANHIQLTPVAAAVGATQVTVTLGATAATANQYYNGLLVVSLDGGTGGVKGYAYQISGHPAAASSGSLTLTLSDPLLNLITTSAKIDLVLNNYSGVIINPTTGSSAPVGAAIWVLPTATYGWIQTQGPASVLNDAGGAITVGNDVTPSTSVAGAIKSLTGTLPTIGTAVTSITASQNGTVRLQLF